MYTPRTSQNEDNLIVCLNHLETIKLKLHRFQKHKNEIEK